jgi:hypothetical protein
VPAAAAAPEALAASGDKPDYEKLAAFGEKLGFEVP